MFKSYRLSSEKKYMRIFLPGGNSIRKTNNELPTVFRKIKKKKNEI